MHIVHLIFRAVDADFILNRNLLVIFLSHTNNV